MRPFAVAAILLLALACGPHTTQANGRRMIVLGIDGMDPGFLESHWDALPNLKRLRDTGDYRRLATTIPPQSPVAWSTVTTGLDPGGHGIYDFVHRNPATRMPVNSMAETAPPKYTIPVGPYRLPLSGGSSHLNRAGRAFWVTLAEHGVPSNIIRMPVNFPPDRCEAETLSGMGTVDLQGSMGTFTFFSDDPGERGREVPGGRIVRVAARYGHAILRLDGPVNTLLRDSPVAGVEIQVYVDPVQPAARFDIGDEPVILRQGEWSGWIPAVFRLIPGVKSARGMFRIYAQQLHPNLRIYVSPVDLDPADPEMPISTPAKFSRSLVSAVGRFYTHGIAEETAAYRAKIFSRAEFLTQSRQVLEESLRLYRYELDRFQSGLLFYYFSSVDQNSHMLWGRHDEELLEIYRAMDGAVGEATAKTDANTTLLVMSDHGFAAFDRAVNLNTWLWQEGFLGLDDPANAGDDELFAHVDWSRTRAYAIGLNAVYLNLQGRENGGTVAAADRQRILDRLKERLLAFRDPATGRPVIARVSFPEREFQGRNLRAAPEIVVGYHRGFRASWQTGLGAVPKAVVEDNDQAWIGDHCIAADEVPGVLLSNRKLHKAEPKLADIPVTILNEFGIGKGAGMIGGPVF